VTVVLQSFGVGPAFSRQFKPTPTPCTSSSKVPDVHSSGRKKLMLSSRALRQSKTLAFTQVPPGKVGVSGESGNSTPPRRPRNRTCVYTQRNDDCELLLKLFLIFSLICKNMYVLEQEHSWTHSLFKMHICCSIA
jgi:hypothetical protein